MAHALPTPARLRAGALAYLVGIALGVDITANAILGGAHYQTISCRIGVSLAAGGWASRLPWPAWFRAHCARSVYSTVF